MTNQTQSQNPAQNNQNNYYDLVTTGMGFLNRPRWVTPDKGKPYLACSINAWHGQNGKESVLFETNVYGQAREALDMLFQAYPQLLNPNAGPKVTVTCGFSIGDGDPDWFSNKKAEYVKCIRGRLFKISWINVNKQRFFTLQTNEAQQEQAMPPVYQQQPQQPETQATQPQPQVQNNHPAQQQYYTSQPQEGYPNHQVNPPHVMESHHQAPQQKYDPQPMQQNAHMQPHQRQQHVHHG